jgi:hypothetical protein
MFKNLMCMMALGASLEAAPVQVTFSGVGSGSLGAQSFTDAQYSITIPATRLRASPRAAPSGCQPRQHRIR